MMPDTGVNKAIGGGAGSGLGGAIAVLIIALAWPKADATAAAALSTVCSAVVGFLGAYFAPHSGAS